MEIPVAHTDSTKVVNDGAQTSRPKPISLRVSYPDTHLAADWSNWECAGITRTPNPKPGIQGSTRPTGLYWDNCISAWLQNALWHSPWVSGHLRRVTRLDSLQTSREPGRCNTLKQPLSKVHILICILQNALWHSPWVSGHLRRVTRLDSLQTSREPGLCSIQPSCYPQDLTRHKPSVSIHLVTHKKATQQWHLSCYPQESHTQYNPSCYPQEI